MAYRMDHLQIFSQFLKKNYFRNTFSLCFLLTKVDWRSVRSTILFYAKFYFILLLSFLFYPCHVKKDGILNKYISKKRKKMY